MAIELRVVQFWSEIILVILNRTRATRSFDFEITRMISDQIALHSVQLPLLIAPLITSHPLLSWSRDTSVHLRCVTILKPATKGTLLEPR